MEKKINVAELLKDCPKGMELDCVIWDSEAKVFLECVLDDDEFAYPIVVTVKYNNIKYTKSFTKYGAFNDLPYCNCVIFPKGKTTWEGFHKPFEDGDIVVTMESINYGTWISIFKGNNENGIVTYADFCVDSNSFYQNSPTILCPNYDVITQRIATEEEKQKLFDAIKSNGYKWNTGTKTLEQLIEPKFKVGDRIKKGEEIATIVRIYKNCYKVKYDNGTGAFSIDLQDEYELVPNKFDINTLVPFESKVLVRNSDSGFWKPAFWGIYEAEKSNEHQNRNYLTTEGFVRHCIPYNDETKHLVGKTCDCPEYYKTW